jgi:hypothetical protein
MMAEAPRPYSAGAPSDLLLGQATSARLARALRDRANAPRGQAQIKAIVAANGTVVRVEIMSSTLSDQARILLIEEARRLRFPSGSERTIIGTVDLG